MKIVIVKMLSNMTKNEQIQLQEEFIQKFTVNKNSTFQKWKNKSLLDFNVHKVNNIQEKLLYNRKNIIIRTLFHFILHNAVKHYQNSLLRKRKLGNS